MQPEIVIVSGHSRIEEGGGVESYLRTLHRGLQRRGVATCLVLGKPGIYKAVAHALSILKAKVARSMDVYVARLNVAGMHAQLRRAVKINALQRPLVFHCHDIFSVLACKRYMQETGVKASIVYTVHALFYEQVLINNPSDRYRKVARAMELEALDACDRILCVSSDRVAALGLRFSAPEKIVHFANTVDQEELDAKLRKHAALPPVSGRYLLLPRHLYKVSGVHVAIEAMAILRDHYADCGKIHLLVVGEGEERENLCRQIATLGVDGRVVLMGKVSHQDVVGLMQQAFAVVLPSVEVDGYIDGCPISMFEAMALGRPLVASDIGGLADVLTDTDAALLFAPGSAQALADAVVRLVNDEPLRDSLVGNARQLMSERHSIDAWISALLRIYFQDSPAPIPAT